MCQPDDLVFCSQLDLAPFVFIGVENEVGHGYYYGVTPMTVHMDV